jgi:hypothetical protein
MRYLKYAALIGVFALLVGAGASTASAQVRVGVGIGVGGPAYGPAPAYVAPEPVCSYGYYSYYPYACAPYGYYGPSYFSGGVFIGAGPWFGWHRPASAPDTTAEATGIAAPPIAADRHLGRLLPRSTGTLVAGSTVGRVSTAEVHFTAGAASTVAAGN